eukprot:CAMPEP_0201714662 /NCGR_PEP_ID=MMETSP0593-20130828/1044_1 /ASSEMBLY_ACC=CAM_ASM_000672 /TAXON_ID=267983 /ORGANISM="Skeletonema japonicum, Strain CCMP2506" /LENGTH=418 /DNA_ID=CAMNT_0048203957 /DNA_START=20 /DNA_END=1276 /DNA_ORIENTATION=-
MTVTTTSTPASKPHRLISTSQVLPHGHLDYVHDISFDYYGRRFATASGDRTVRVWDLNSDGMWMSGELGGSGGGGKANEWVAARGAVRRVCWSHPEFGQLLATAGADHSVVIWEEREGNFKSLATPDENINNNAAMAGGTNTASGDTSSSSSRWVQKATLSDARRAVTTVQFAPRHLGLRLATGSADGVVRIYEALDTSNLNHWKLDGVIEAGVEDAVDTSEAVVVGRQSMTIGGENSSNENMGVSSLSWCTGRFEPATLCVGCSSGRASVYRYDDGARSWVEAIRLPNHATANGVPRGVLDVAWAPNVGRSYHLIATCGKDHRLKVHRVKRGRGGKGGEGGAQAAASSSLVYEGTEDLDRSEVWRCQWNLTGTVLASSGDCGVVKLWKSDFQGKFKCISEIVGDTTGMAAASAVRQR